MKKSVSLFAIMLGLGCGLAAILLTSPALAATATCDPNSPFFCNPLSVSGKGINTVGDALVVIIKFLLSVIGIISMGFIIASGLKYVTSAGSEEKVTEAKNTLTSSVTGLALALMAYGIVKALEEILQVK